ncbi:hypothetical protein CULT_2320009 [[Clostridium] ultunense Esp]|nr:hypothetical protein CULT_2320009 [[Clostridium] ultunense Esp]
MRRDPSIHVLTEYRRCQLPIPDWAGQWLALAEDKDRSLLLVPSTYI